MEIKTPSTPPPPSHLLHRGHRRHGPVQAAVGYDVMFLTGTDEHGQKIEDKAKEAGVTPKEFVDNIVEGPRGVLDLWKLMNISNDRFIRTTDDYHVEIGPEDFQEDVRQGRHLQGHLCGQILHPPASPSGPRASWWTASAPTAAGRCRTRRRRPISSA